MPLPVLEYASLASGAGWSRGRTRSAAANAPMRKTLWKAIRESCASCRMLKTIAWIEFR